MKNIRIYYLKISNFLAVKFTVYLNRHVFVIGCFKRKEFAPKGSIVLYSPALLYIEVASWLYATKIFQGKYVVQKRCVLDIRGTEAVSG